MFTWTKIIVLLLGVLGCATVVAICDIAIIQEIKKARKVFRGLTTLITALLNKEEE